MSGPPDPSRGRDPDREWPTEDFDAGRGAQREGAPADLPPEVTGGAAPPSRDWDDWPPITPPDEPYGLDEPLPPSSDPWAESWADEASAGLPLGTPEAPAERGAFPDGRQAMPAEPAWTPPEPEPAWTPPEGEPPSIFPQPDPAWSEPEAGPTGEAEQAPGASTVSWSPEGAFGTPSELTEPAAPVEPMEPPEREAGWSRPWSPDTAPDWMTEPGPMAEPAEPEPAEAAAEPLPAWAPGLEPVPAATPEPEAAAPQQSAIEPETEHEPAPDPRFLAEPAVFAPPTPPARVEPEPEPAPEPWEPAAEAVAEPPVAADASAVGEELTAQDVAEPTAEDVAEPPWVWAPRPDPMAQPPAEPAPGEMDLEPLWAPPDAAEPRDAERPYPGGEPTQVFPSSWTPPPPPPRELDPAAGAVRTSFGENAAADTDEAVLEQPAIAEQAVPWLIGVILLLAGMVIVLIALIFAGDASLGGRGASPSASLPGVAAGSGEPGGTATAGTPRASATRTARPSPTPVPLPAYGALELVYQGRAEPLAPIYLLLHDFTVEAAPVVLAQDPTLDVRRFSFSHDGTVGAALLGNSLVSVEEGVDKRPLGDGFSTATFGDDPATVYAVRIVQEGTNDTAIVLAVNFLSAEATELARVTYARPQIAPEAALQEAQFADDGGTVRLFWMDDETLWLWILGAGAWQVDPGSQELSELADELPVLWAPDREARIVVTEAGATTTLDVVDEDGQVLASTAVDMVVSHIRWSRDSQRVTFTGGRLAGGGGVLQDLFLWDPYEEGEPRQLTSTGAAFGAEWRGTLPVWQPPE